MSVSPNFEAINNNNSNNNDDNSKNNSNNDNNNIEMIEEIDYNELENQTISVSKYRTVSVKGMQIESKKSEKDIQLIRFKETDEEYEKLRLLSLRIFTEWDILKDGIISVQEMIDSGMDKEFASSVVRVLDYDGSGVVHFIDLLNCINVLNNGTIKDKVNLLLKFLDRDQNNEISPEEAEVYLQFAPYELCEKLGLLDPYGNKKKLACNDLLGLFENSERGEEAINIFCQQIIRILQKPSNNSRTHRFFDTPPTCTPSWTKINIFSKLSKLWNIEKSSLFIIALICLQIALYIYNFMFHYTRDFPIAYCIAKGSGLNLRILPIFLFFSMARSTMGTLYSFSTFRPFIPMGFNIQIHSFIGFSLVLHSFIHMGGHIAYHEVFVKGGFGHSFVQESIIRGASWHHKGSGDAITGYILMVSLLLMAITALFRSHSSKAYAIFSTTHFLYVGWLIFLCLHVPHFWPYFVIVGILFFAERLNDFLHLTIHSTLSFSRPGTNGVTFLSVPRAGTGTYPGSYYRIKVPAISPVEWHPFSLAGSASSHHLTFFVASNGDWTRELYRLVSDPVKRDTTVIQVQGPFFAPAFTASKKSTELNLLVASGIGITPFFSLMATKVSEEQSYESDRQIYAALFQENIDHRGGSFTSIKALRQWGLLQESHIKTVDIEKLHVVWSIRDVSELLFYLNYVYELVKHQHSFEHPAVFVDVYLTGLGKSSDLRYMMAQTLLILSLSSKTSQYMKIHFGRPEFKNIISTLSPHNVYYCGGSVLKDSLREICLQQKVSFHPEDFDSGGSIISDTYKKIYTYFTTESIATKKSKAITRRNSISRIPSASIHR